MMENFGANHLVTVFSEAVTKIYANVTFGHDFILDRDQIYKLASFGHGVK